MDKKIILKRIDELMKEKGITNYQLKENADISSKFINGAKMLNEMKRVHPH